MNGEKSGGGEPFGTYRPGNVSGRGQRLFQERQALVEEAAHPPEALERTTQAESRLPLTRCQQPLQRVQHVFVLLRQEKDPRLLRRVQEMWLGCFCQCHVVAGIGAPGGGILLPGRQLLSVILAERL